MFSFTLFIATWAFLALGTFVHPAWVLLAVLSLRWMVTAAAREERKKMGHEVYWREAGSYTTIITAYALAGTFGAALILLAGFVTPVTLAALAIFALMLFRYGVLAAGYALRVLSEE